jgi:hypothetical protein
MPSRTPSSADLSDVFLVELGADGRFGYRNLELYWLEPERRFPFLVRYDARVVGFVLATRGSPVTDDPNVFDIAEFLCFVAIVAPAWGGERRCFCGSVCPARGSFVFPRGTEVLLRFGRVSSPRSAVALQRSSSAMEVRMLGACSPSIPYPRKSGTTEEDANAGVGR